MMFALASALRLARFNVMIDEDKPRWQKDFFTGMPTPAAAIVVLLPVYLASFGFDLRDAWWMKNIVIVYTLLIAFLMVSNIPTYSGKLLGERISREWVLPIFVLAVLYVAMLFTYPHETLAGTSMLYLAMIPVGWWRFQKYLEQDAQAGVGTDSGGAPPEGVDKTNAQSWMAEPQPGAKQPVEAPGKSEDGRVVELRTPEPRS
jgi:CDP-diacylglycerol--serine O-phosphatidyltransferase